METLEMETEEEATIGEIRETIINNHGGETQAATTMAIKMGIEMDLKMVLEISSATRINLEETTRMETQLNHANLLPQKWLMWTLTLASSATVHHTDLLKQKNAYMENQIYSQNPVFLAVKVDTIIICVYKAKSQLLEPHLLRDHKSHLTRNSAPIQIGIRTSQKGQTGKPQFQKKKTSKCLLYSNGEEAEKDERPNHSKQPH